MKYVRLTMMGQNNFFLRDKMGRKELDLMNEGKGKVAKQEEMKEYSYLSPI